MIIVDELADVIKLFINFIIFLNKKPPGLNPDGFLEKVGELSCWLLHLSCHY